MHYYINQCSMYINIINLNKLYLQICNLQRQLLFQQELQNNKLTNEIKHCKNLMADDKQTKNKTK